jgi:hypothetical protein
MEVFAEEGYEEIFNDEDAGSLQYIEVILPSYDGEYDVY